MIKDNPAKLICKNCGQQTHEERRIMFVEDKSLGATSVIGQDQPSTIGVQSSQSPDRTSDSKLDLLFNQVNGLQDALSRFVERYELRSTAIEERLAAAQDRFMAVGDRLTAVNDRMTIMQERLSTIEKASSLVDTTVQDHLKALEEHLCKVDSSVESPVEGRLKSLEFTVETVKSTVDCPRDHVDNSGCLLDSKFENRMISVDERLSDIEKAVQTLESFILTVADKQFLTSDVLRVLPTAKRLGMKHWTKKLVYHLLNGLSNLNCVTLFHFARKYELRDLLEASQKMIFLDFDKISESSEELVDLTLEELKVFLFSDKIHATEEHVMTGITRWIRKDKNNRRQLAKEFLPAIRLDKCSFKFLRQLEQHFLVQKDTDFLSRVKETLDNGQHRDEDQWRWPQLQDVLFIMGGNSSYGMVETLNTSSNKWITHKIPNAPSSVTWLGTVNQTLLVVEEFGGRVRSFDCLQRTWKSRQPLGTPRRFSCFVQEGSTVYALGGEDHGTRCDIYHTQKDEWSQVAGMKNSRKFAGGASLEGLVYCAGGRSEPGETFLSSVEEYSPSHNRWSRIPPLAVARSSHAVVSCGRFLWVVGILDSTDISTLEQYDPRTKSWRTLQSSPLKRISLSACFYEGQMYVTGGYTRCTGDITTVEIYDPNTNTWTTADPLGQKRCFHGSCVVSSLSKDAKYDEFCGLHSETDCLLHGELYVECSRVGTPIHLHI